MGWVVGVVLVAVSESPGYCAWSALAVRAVEAGAPILAVPPVMRLQETLHPQFLRFLDNRPRGRHMLRAGEGWPLGGSRNQPSRYG